MVVTDYPDANLTENLAYNVARNIGVEKRKRIDVQVFLKKKKKVTLDLIIIIFFFHEYFANRDTSGDNPFILY